jgi:hypothetical protein
MLVQAMAMAQNPIDGVWKIDLTESESSTKIYEYLLQDNTYRCTTCDPPLDIRADGRDHKITGVSCYDTVSLKVVDDSTTLETDKRNRKTVGTSRMRVSSEGNSATFEWTESCSTNGDVVSGKDILSRERKGPSGSHAVSGSWEISKRVNRSENALVVILKLEDDTFSFTDPGRAGLHREARWNGGALQRGFQQHHGFGQARWREHDRAERQTGRESGRSHSLYALR